MLRVIGLLFIASVCDAASVLTLDTYLNQVKTDNGFYTGSLQNQSASLARHAESKLITAPTFEGKFQYQKDQKMPDTPVISYDALEIGAYSVGITKKTRFGLDASAAYDLSSFMYVNSNIGQFGGKDSIANARPSLSLTQSFWKNKGGRLTQDLILSKEAQAKIEYYTAQALMDTTLQQAIVSYWALALQREIINIRKLSVQHAQSIYEYNVSRSRMNLGEEADTFASKASLEARKLDLQVALDAEAAQIRLFNQQRGKSASDPVEPLMRIDWHFLKSFKLPSKRSDRSDVQAAHFQTQLADAQSRIQAENSKPLFNAYMSYSLNNRSTTIGDAFSGSITTEHPTTIVGFLFSMPLDSAALQTLKKGAIAQAEAAQLSYAQKLKNQESDWIDLNAAFVAAQKRLILAEKIEDAQKNKLDFERDRLRKGRTSTYQVLLFEQDYTLARLARIQIASDMIGLFSRAQLYINLIEGK